MVKLGTNKNLTDVPCLVHVIIVLVQKLIATGETGEVSGTYAKYFRSFYLETESRA